MDISGKAGGAQSGAGAGGDSFAQAVRKAGPDGGAMMAKSFAAGDLASGLAFLPPDFIPAVGEGMLEAIAMGEGANDEMKRYEELVDGR